jgi:hypothetical protein
MSAADKLVIVENSGSLSGSVTSSLMQSLEWAAEGQSGCSYAFQSYGSSLGVVVDFHVSGQGGLAELGQMPSFQKSMDSGGGGTYLNELLALALSKHLSAHGKLPSAIVYWSDFIDRPPSRGLMDKAASSGESSAWLDLSGVHIICAVAQSGGDLGPGRIWAKGLEKETGARAEALPSEGIVSLMEARELAASTRMGARLKVPPRI